MYVGTHLCTSCDVEAVDTVVDAAHGHVACRRDERWRREYGLGQQLLPQDAHPWTASGRVSVGGRFGSHARLLVVPRRVTAEAAVARAQRHDAAAEGGDNRNAPSFV